MSEYTRLILSRRGPVATVTMNRPEVHNAFDEALIAEIVAAFEELSEDGETRVCILAGAGASFSAGADLEWMQRMAGYSHEENLADATALHYMFDTIATVPYFTIARVHGAAIGGGLGLIAVCDTAVAEDNARQVPAKPRQFGLSEVRLGLAPAVIAPYVVRRLVPGVAHSLFLTGRRFSAREAYSFGLVQQVVEPGEIDEAVAAIVDDVLQSGPEAIAATKRLMAEIDGKSPAESARATTACIAALRASPEGQEGIRAFLEKRKPSFAAQSISQPT